MQTGLSQGGDVGIDFFCDGNLGLGAEIGWFLADETPGNGMGSK